MFRRGLVLLAATGTLGSMGLAATPAIASTGGGSSTTSPGASHRPVPPPVINRDAAAADKPDPVVRRPVGAPPPVAPLPTGSWQALGPAPIGASPSNAFSGRITSMVVIPSGTHAGRVVIGSAGGGIWTSDNSGSTWTSRTDTADDLAIGSIAEDPSTADHLIAGTGEGNNSADSYPGDGILTSSDGGTTWTRQDPGGVFDDVHIEQVAIDQSDSNHQFAATDAGLFVTTDGGTSWAEPTNTTYANSLHGEVTAVVIDPSNSNNIYIGTDATGIVGKSTDGGTTWTVANSGLASSNYGLVALAIAPSSPSTLYVALGNFDGATGVKLYKTTTSAGSWSQITSAPDYTGQAFYYGSGSADQGWYDNVLTVDPSNANHVVAGGIGLAEGTFNGTSWTWSQIDIDHPDQHALAITSTGDLWIGNDGGVYHRPSGGSASPANGNLNITQLYFGFNVVGNTILAGSQDNSSVETTSTTLSPWTQIFGGDGGPSYTTPNDTSLQFIEADSDLYVTTDGFATTLNNITPPQVGEFTPPIAVIPNTTTPSAPTVFYGGPDVYRTTNPSAGSPSWTKVTSIGSAVNRLEVTALAVSPSSSSVVYAGFSNGTIEVSTDGGQTFTAVTADAGRSENWVTGISVDPSNPKAITASFSFNDTRYFTGFPHVDQFSYSTTPGTGTWTTISGSGLPNAVGRVVYDNGDLLAATDSGVYATASPNGGSTTWTRVGSGLPNVQVQDLFVADDGTVYAVTHGLGAWKLPVPTTTTHTPADFDGDGKTDVAIYRPSTGYWHIHGQSSVYFGDSADIPVPGDYNGDGTADPAVFRPSTGYWHIKGQSSVPFGVSGDIPVPGDYNGDGTTDVAVFRPTTGYWYIKSQPTVYFGQSGDIPVPGDYDGDGKTDIAVFRPTTGYWYIKSQPTVHFGQSGDIPVPGDYDGDGKTDIAVYRPSAGYWFIKGQPSVYFGTSSDTPVPGDYNGDGKTDIAVYRSSTGYWFTQGQPSVYFGTSGDVPVVTLPGNR